MNVIIVNPKIERLYFDSDSRGHEDRGVSVVGAVVGPGSWARPGEGSAGAAWVEAGCWGGVGGDPRVIMIALHHASVTPDM